LYSTSFATAKEEVINKITKDRRRKQDFAFGGDEKFILPKDEMRTVDSIVLLMRAAAGSRNQKATKRSLLQKVRIVINTIIIKLFVNHYKYRKKISAESNAYRKKQNRKYREKKEAKASK
jgi:hypothetical protein